MSGRDIVNQVKTEMETRQNQHKQPEKMESFPL